MFLGIPNYPVNRRPSFESKYGPASPATSDTNSVRSDSPSLSNVPPGARQSLLNGHQTPPPLPPRAPINSHHSQPGPGPAPSPTGQVGGEGNIMTPNFAQQVSEKRNGIQGRYKNMW